MDKDEDLGSGVGAQPMEFGGWVCGTRIPGFQAELRALRVWG